jgi:hypothetical protein
MDPVDNQNRSSTDMTRPSHVTQAVRNPSSDWATDPNLGNWATDEASDFAMGQTFKALKLERLGVSKEEIDKILSEERQQRLKLLHEKRDREQRLRSK